MNKLSTLAAHASLLAAALLLAPPAAHAQFSAEQIQRIQEQMRQLGFSQPGIQPAEPTLPAAPAISEAEMAGQLEALGPSTGGITVERFRDGFSIDGKRHLDYEGEITKYAFDVLTGDITYLARVTPMQYKVKTMRARTGQEPVTIATASKNMGLWQVQTATGKTLGGSAILPLSRGVLIVRDNVAFKYLPGKGISNIVGPEDFTFAHFQNGDIEGTGHILMERIPEPSENSADNFMSNLKTLGSMLGVNKKEDYLLLHTESGKTLPLNVSVDGKQVNVYSQCTRRNAALSQCDRMDSFDALYDPNVPGTPNLSHYYWRISWFKTPQGPVLVAQEGGLGKIVATNLASGKQATLFSRALGIAGFSTRQGADGKIGVTAQMGFTKEAIDDVVAFMNVPPVAEQKETTAANPPVGERSGKVPSVF